MRILLLAPGTRGDVAPAARLASDLVADGHDVTMVASEEYAELVRESGSTHVPIRASLTPEGGSGTEPGVRAYLATLRNYMEAAATAALAASTGAEMVLTNAISPYGHDIAEALGVPSAEALLQPSFPARAYPPMIASGRDLGPVGNLIAGQLALRAPTPYDAACARVRRGLGLRPESRRAAQQRRRRQGMPVHHGISSVVLPRPKDWPAELLLDGFWWAPMPKDWTPPQALVNFLAAGPPPVVITLGSLPVGRGTTEIITEAVREGATRFVVQGEQLRPVVEALGPARAIHAGDVPHEWLFPQVAAAVHQAGAGVTAAALRAGVPSVPLPQHTDQPFWARRLIALSATTSPMPLKSLTAQGLRARIEEASTSSDLLAGARAVRSLLAVEDGTQPLRSWVADLHG